MTPVTSTHATTPTSPPSWRSAADPPTLPVAGTTWGLVKKPLSRARPYRGTPILWTPLPHCHVHRTTVWGGQQVLLTPAPPCMEQGAPPREGAHPTTYHHTPANATSCRAPAGAAFSGDDVTGAAGSSRFPASHPAGYTTQDFASHPLHNNNPWFEGSSVRQRPYHSDYNRLDLG